MKIEAYLFNAELRRYSDGMFSIDSTSFTMVSIASTWLNIWKSPCDENFKKLPLVAHTYGLLTYPNMSSYNI